MGRNSKGQDVQLSFRQNSSLVAGRTRSSSDSVCLSGNHSLCRGLRRYSLSSTTSFTDTAPQLRKRLEKELGIPSFLFERLYRQLNGFAGHNVQLDREQKVEAYSKRTTHISKNLPTGLTGYSALVTLHGKTNVRKSHAKKDIHTTYIVSPART